jgi:transcriptional regulator of acetoin/glycerol metabolism
MPAAISYEAFVAVSAIFESLGKGVALLDSELRIVEASPAVRGLLGTPEVEGHSIAEVFDAPEMVECLRAGRRCDGDVRIRGGATVRARGGALTDRSFAPAARYVISIDVNDGLSAGTRGADAERIIRALDAHRWRRSAAARALGISRATLWRRMREYGII